MPEHLSKGKKVKGPAEGGYLLASAAFFSSAKRVDKGISIRRVFEVSKGRGGGAGGDWKCTLFLLLAHQRGYSLFVALHLASAL